MLDDLDKFCTENDLKHPNELVEFTHLWARGEGCRYSIYIINCLEKAGCKNEYTESVMHADVVRETRCMSKLTQGYGLMKTFVPAPLLARVNKIVLVSPA